MPPLSATETKRVARPFRMAESERERMARRLRADTSAEVRFDAGSLALYSVDASNYRQIPIGVVIPRTKEDVIRTVAVCREFGAPLVSRGGGTSLCGQACNVAVVMDMSKFYNQILSLDPAARTARVQPGVVLDRLRDAAERHHLTFGPDPATHNRCTLGGMLGNNSCGVHAVMAGTTDRNVLELEVLTYDGTILTVGPTTEPELNRRAAEEGRVGEIYRGVKAIIERYGTDIRNNFVDIPRFVSGYNLNSLLTESGTHLARALVGSEGTLVTILEAKLRLVESPPHRVVVVLGYPSVFEAGDHVVEIRRFGAIGLEGMDRTLIDNMTKKKLNVEHLSLLPDGHGWLLVEFGGRSRNEALAQAKGMIDQLKKGEKPPLARIVDNETDQEKVWEIRESGLGATARVPGAPDTWPGWEDSAVAPANIGRYLRDLQGLYERYDYNGSLYGHFGDGCVHTRVNFDLTTKEGVAKFRSFIDEASTLVVEHGGTLSGEHGDGQSKAEFLAKRFGTPILDAFRDFKTLWDPDWKMNPGKVVDPYRIDDDLRFGPGYQSANVSTHFSYPDDDGNFERATLRCVGVGQCRKDDAGVMCPSFMVTREEMHSTRGRAHLLYEMLRGETVKGGWRDENVKEALDLCLACKGCKTECPVNVDIATYKAEFNAHYYEGRLRPRSAYAFGLIYWWARLGALAPRAVNFFSRTPPFSRLAKEIAGMAPRRNVPSFSPETFRRSFTRRQDRTPPTPGARQKPARPHVLLWPDTFNNHFHADTLASAARMLNRAGFNVRIPRINLCCGRPLYDQGMLPTAKRLLRQIMRVLKDDIDAGVPIVGLEPSCVSVFKDELLSLFPNDERARKLSGLMFGWAEFFEKNGHRLPEGRFDRKAIYQGHCHQKALWGFDHERALFQRAGMDFEVLDSGCCGMAGPFGFEKKSYDVSIGAAKRVLAPAVARGDRDTFVVADGFSCREQIEQLTGRKALHTAEMMERALRNVPDGPAEEQNSRRREVSDG